MLIGTNDAVAVQQPSATDPLEPHRLRYKLVKGNFDWHEAKADAELRSGHLATIVSAKEWEVIQSVIGRENLEGKVIWIGGTDHGTEGDSRDDNGSERMANSE